MTGTFEHDSCAFLETPSYLEHTELHSVLSQVLHSCWWCVSKIGTNHYRNLEASWNFSDPPVNDRNSDINLDDFLLQHAGIHPIPGRLWAVKLSKTVKSIFGRCPIFNLHQETKYLEIIFAYLLCLWKYINAKDHWPFHSFNPPFAVVLSCTVPMTTNI